MSKILIVDDNAKTRKMLHRHLKKENYEILEAENGQFALEKIRAELPEVVLLDVMMPDMSGFDVCQQLRKTPQHELVYIIMLTALTSNENKIEGLDLGADDYVIKPFDIYELLARIRVGERTVTKKRDAIIDELTKTYNKTYFNMYIAQEINRSERYHHELSLIIADIDYFKKVNDNYGHLVGDKVLKEVAQVIIQQCRVSDLVARWGGEEFVILLPETDLENGKLVAERICQAIATHTFEEVQHLTMSFGVATLATDGNNLLERADTALYQAKKSGRNRVVTYA
jgi:diguanylate cyclase (GGDEF)-like protein